MRPANAGNAQRVAKRNAAKAAALTKASLEQSMQYHKDLLKVVRESSRNMIPIYSICDVLPYSLLNPGKTMRASECICRRFDFD